MRPALLCLLFCVFLSSCELLRGDGRVLLGAKVLYVDSQTVTCQGAHEQQCLRVREDPAADWELFYNAILDFAFEPGFQYKLKVKVYEIKNPPADGSSLAYELVEVLEKQ